MCKSRLLLNDVPVFHELEKNPFRELICLLFFFFNIIIDSETVNSSSMKTRGGGGYSLIWAI